MVDKKEKIDKAMMKICYLCSAKINISKEKDHHVQVHTINRPTKCDDHTYWHFQCWTDYFNSRVEKRMKENIRNIQAKAVEVFNSPMLKGLLSQVQGSKMVLQMLEHPISDNTAFVSKEKVKKKIQNDRKKRTKTKK